MKRADIVDLSRYRERLRPPEDSIHVDLRADSSHRWHLRGAYAASPMLALQALAEVAADIATQSLDDPKT